MKVHKSDIQFFPQTIKGQDVQSAMRLTMDKAYLEEYEPHQFVVHDNDIKAYVDDLRSQGITPYHPPMFKGIPLMDIPSCKEGAITLIAKVVAIKELEK